MRVRSIDGGKGELKTQISVWGILNEETQGDPPSPSPPGETSLRIMTI